MRMSLDHLRSELRGPHADAVATAFLDLVSWRSRKVMELREQIDDPRITVAGANVLLHVFIFGMLEKPGGSSVSQIVGNLDMPRRTVRDTLRLWEEHGLVVREEGVFHPTEKTAEMFNDEWPERFRLLGKLCSAFHEYRKAMGR